MTGWDVGLEKFHLNGCYAFCGFSTIVAETIELILTNVGARDTSIGVVNPFTLTTDCKIFVTLVHVYYFTAYRSTNCTNTSSLGLLESTSHTFQFVPVLFFE